MQRTMPCSQSVVAQNGNNEDPQLASFIERRRFQLKMSCEQAAKLAGLGLSQWLALESGWIPPSGENIWWALAGTLEIGINKITYLADVSRQARELHPGGNSKHLHLAAIIQWPVGPRTSGKAGKISNCPGGVHWVSGCMTEEQFNNNQEKR